MPVIQSISIHGELHLAACCSRVWSTGCWSVPAASHWNGLSHHILMINTSSPCMWYHVLFSQTWKFEVSAWMYSLTEVLDLGASTKASFRRVRGVKWCRATKLPGLTKRFRQGCYKCIIPSKYRHMNRWIKRSCDDSHRSLPETCLSWACF